jgi:hypothetical protein
VVEAVTSNAKPGQRSVPLVVAERSDFFPWSSDNLVFKRGPALIFSKDNCLLAKDFEVALKHLEYSPKLIHLSQTKETLNNGWRYLGYFKNCLNYFKLVSHCGLMSNEGSLFVVVIAPIEGVEERNSTGLTVSLGGDTPVPIGHLTNNFITSNCATFAEKPKVFIFIDPGVATNSMDRGVLVSTLKNQNKLLLHKKVVKAKFSPFSKTSAYNLQES